MADKTPEIEYADATKVRVLETNILHVNDVVYWLDGSSAEVPLTMNRITHPLIVNFTTRPRDMNVLHKPGKMAVWRRPAEDMVEGIATGEQKERPTISAFDLAGEVSDPRGRFNPALFDVSLGGGDGAVVLLYPTPLGTSLSPLGGITGSLRFQSNNNPAVWALLELEVTVSVVDTQIYRAQADKNGDFSVALNRLPPLPESVTEYDAVLRITALDTVLADTTPDTTTFISHEIEASEAQDDFSTDFALAVRPGEVRRIQSFDKNHLAVQPA